MDTDELGRENGFVQRVRKLDGSRFIQTPVFEFLAKPAAGYGKLSESASTIGVAIGPQGLEQRFTPTAAKFVRRVLARAVEQVIASQPAAVPILQRFAGVYTCATACAGGHCGRRVSGRESGADHRTQLFPR